MKFLFFCVLLLMFNKLSGRIIREAFKRRADECDVLLDTLPDTCLDYWSGENPPLVVISLDGFRPDYLEKKINASGIQEPAARLLNLLSRCGVFAPNGMTPVFPSVTFPNHYSIVTGLYPESHGIVDNFFYDPDLNASFIIFSPQQTNSLWWIGDPLWHTAREQGKITASYFWPGSDQTDLFRAPNYWFNYDSSMPIPFADRLQQVFDWLVLPVGERPHFTTVWLSEPDTTGHYEGPTSPLLAEQIRAVDDVLQGFFDQLDERNLLSCIDIIILSDHGMAPSPPGEQFFIMNNYVPNISVDARVYDGVLPTIRPKMDTEEEHNRIAGGLECQDPNMRVYNKWDFPRRHHYANTNRIPNILLDMTLSWRAYADSEYILPGEHGWDNLNSEMQALFVAHGPSFKKKSLVRSFHNIDLYNLMCNMMNVDPLPNNGTWGALHHMLVNPPANPTTDPGISFPTLPFPATDSAYLEHLQRDRCNLLTQLNSPQLDSTLNITSSSASEALLLHTPWGEPQNKDTENLRTVVSNDYVAGIDVVTGVTTWTSYTLNKPRTAVANSWWRLDIRLEFNHSSLCERLPNGIDSTMYLVPLFPFASTTNVNDVGIDTNAIEISKSMENYWTEFHSMLNNSLGDNAVINVITGPVRDSISPGLFFIVSTCSTPGVQLASCSVDALDMQAFILPTNVRYSRECIDANKFFRNNLATLADIEHLTGIRFFPLLSYEGKVDLLSRTPLASSLLVNGNPSML